MKINLKIILILFISYISILQSMTINRVILATNNNPDYIQFWPLVAKAWKDKIGVKITIALIGDENVKIDESLGDVIRFDPIPGIPTSFHAQTVRLLLPCLFENEISIIADIDMIPLSKNSILDPIEEIEDDKFVVYNDQEYKGLYTIYPMCYNAAKGSIFKEIFGIKDKEDISSLISYWHKTALKLTESLNTKLPGNNAEKQKALNNLIWRTDERMLTGYLHAWKYYNTRCFKLGKTFYPTLIDKENWKYDIEKLKKEHYKNANLPRPYNNPENKKKITKLLIDIGWEDIIPTQR